MNFVKARDAKVFLADLTAMVLLGFFAHLAGHHSYHDPRTIFFEHASQYFSTILTWSPKSKMASIVARLPHVEQYFSLLALGLTTKGWSVIRDFTISY
jgi:hypothetical protein